MTTITPLTVCSVQEICETEDGGYNIKPRLANGEFVHD
jgi:hypothetical protein